MKIVADQRQPQAVQTVENKSDNAQANAAASKRKGRALAGRDSVELSPSQIDAEVKNRQAEQARKVERIKTLVQSGKYQVSSQDVAEKILSRASGK